MLVEARHAGDVVSWGAQLAGGRRAQGGPASVGGHGGSTEGGARWRGDTE